MKHGTQKIIAEKAGLSPQFVSNILNGLRRPSWENACRLAEATGTTPEVWMSEDAELMRAAAAEIEKEVSK